MSDKLIEIKVGILWITSRDEIGKIPTYTFYDIIPYIGEDTVFYDAVEKQKLKYDKDSVFTIISLGALKGMYDKIPSALDSMKKELAKRGYRVTNERLVKSEQTYNKLG